jgi:hypothetical protein
MNRLYRTKTLQLCLMGGNAKAIQSQGTCLARRNERKKENMPLIQVLLALIVVGVLLWLVNRFIPMEGTIKSILNGVVVIAVVLWLLNIFGLFHSLAHIHVGT